jgi:hypothetical protein
MDKATIALVVVTGALAVIAVLQLFAFRNSEKRRTQPVAISHRFKPRDEYDKFAVFLTNEGTGTAFNVRFGVRLDGTEYAVGGGRGHRYVLGPGARIPTDPSKYLTVEISYAPYALAKGGRDVDSRAIFWARYENAFGVVYETKNPVEPLADFEVRRSFASARWLQETRQARKRANDEKTASRRVAEEFKVNLDPRRLPWARKLARRFGR